jgi:hypothetical protein
VAFTKKNSDSISNTSYLSSPPPSYNLPFVLRVSYESALPRIPRGLQVFMLITSALQPQISRICKFLWCSRTSEMKPSPKAVIRNTGWLSS